jgi:maltose O-acetyltransferase
MTEKEKLLSGEYYNSRDPELIEMYHRAKEILREWSALSTRDGEKRYELLRDLFVHVGKGVWIEGPFYCDYGKHVSIGENTFINTGAVLLDCNRIDIGKNVLLGPHVQIYTATHPLAAGERIKNNPLQGEASYLTRALPVKIGDNTWIGGNVLIMPGVTIGAGVTVAAGSVVTKDIPDNVLAMGVPAAVVKIL